MSTPPAATVFAPAPPPPASPRREGAGIQVGDILNHIFEVRRFIARGGMGEVFEGVNVNSEERVAIKVMLPALAADPSIQAMFRKEARTLTRLNSPALVQYRVLAQEPQLGVFYIVTEYIDGANLCDLLSGMKAEPEELVALTARLASGLQVAHALGAIHRDISPDNVLLEGGRLDQAKIIDFGIAKDLDPGSKTIVGDGFAGKLGYVAPEHLGDFDRQIGPWTDVYSLGLVILAVALGRNPDLGGSFVEAIDKRRKGLDLSTVPDALRPVLARMLQPDPAERYRTMDEVVVALRAPPPVAFEKKEKAAAAPKPAKAAKPLASGAGNRAKSRVPLIGGGIAALALLLAGAGYIAFGGNNPHPAALPAAPTITSPEAKARVAIAQTLPTIQCSWLDLTGVDGATGGISARFAGVAGKPAEAQAAVAGAVSHAGSALAATDFAEVAPISASECQSIDAFRAIRAPGEPHLSVPQRKFEMSKLPVDSPYAGAIGARVLVTLAIADPSQDFAVYGIEPSGEVSPVIANRKALTALLVPGSPIASLGGDRYRLQVDANHSGWSGFVLLRGRGGFADNLVVSKPGARPANWAQHFAEAARANGWQADMVWFKMVDELPN